ncbi:MAG: signal peptide peptidase SppA [Thermodesulfobacteriota bacterium]
MGVVELFGPILSPEDTLADLAEMRRDDAVKAIVLRIDSPGGAVGAAQEIYAEVLRTDKVKPVIASMGSLAASGGYYAAIGARKIYANPGTLTGSIGVIAKFANLEELFAKIGYRSEVIKSGALKDIGSPDRTMTEEERLLLQEVLDSVHGQFIAAVAQRRNLAEDEVRKLADGRILSGQQAMTAGLIDGFGNLTDAAQAAAAAGGVEDGGEPKLIYPGKDEPFWKKFLSVQADSWIAALSRLRLPFLSYEWKGPTGG